MALKIENEKELEEHVPLLSLQKYLNFQEKEYLKKILHFTHGNKAKAARILEIDRATLWRKMEKYGLSF